MSKNRSPREVCSMTDGMMRFDGRSMLLLTAGGPEFRVGRLLFLFGSPERFARLGELARNPRDLRGDAVERVAQAQVLTERLEAAGLAEPLDRRIGVVADLRQDFFLDLLHGHGDDLLLVTGELELDLLRLAGVHADERLLDLFDDRSAPELDHVVAPGLPLR